MAENDAPDDPASAPPAAGSRDQTRSQFQFGLATLFICTAVVACLVRFYDPFEDWARAHGFERVFHWLEDCSFYFLGFTSPAFVALGGYLWLRHHHYRVLALVLIGVSSVVAVCWTVLFFGIGAPDPDPEGRWIADLVNFFEWASPYLAVVFFGGLVGLFLAIIVLRVLLGERRALQSRQRQ
jgi:hypothetical protein